MREIGVRELKASLSEVIRSVQAGDAVRVTRNGTPVAEILPPRQVSFDERMDGLAAQGLVRRPRERGPLPPPPPLVELPGDLSASDIVIADREEERD